MVFLTLIMFAGTFWGFIEAFLFWYLDDLGASHFLMGWTVAVGMITSLPFLVNIKTNFFVEHLICSQISDRKFSVSV
jgi:hypothetical protein